MQLWTLHSQLLVALQYNDISTAESILQQGVDPDLRFCIGSHQMPAICLCAERGHYDMSKLLIEYGCSVNQTDDCGFSPIHFACNHLCVDIVKLLISHRANVNATSNYGHTPLHMAVQQPSLEVVTLLIEAGSDLEKKDYDGRTPLALACMSNHFNIVEYLVLQGSDVNTADNCGNTPLLNAINSGLCINGEIVKILLQAGANPNQTNKYGLSPLITTIRRSSDHCLVGQETVQTLIDHDCDLDVYEYESPICGENALHLAITRSQDRITEMLIRAGCNVNINNQNGCSPLARLAKIGKTDLIKLLIAVGADLKLPKQFWTSEAQKIQEFDDFGDSELRNLLLNQSTCFPKLKHLSRISLRSWLGRRADTVIKQMNLPTTVKRYLLLLEM